MRPNPSRRPQRGVSLVEALVAMGVMAFGMLGVVGMQATLRSNADVAKQRAEAVRVAQAAIEDWRSFAVLDTTGGAPAWADIGSITGGSDSHYTSANTNTAYTIDATVVTPGAGAPKYKNFDLSVSWADRNGQPQSVQLVGSIARIAPELAGSLALPRDRAPTQRPGGRHAGIPPFAVYNTAIDRYTLTPLASGPTYVFDSLTGAITQDCTVEPATPANPPGGCTAVKGMPLSGFIRFATGGAPTTAEAEIPIDSPVPGIGVAISLAAPVSPSFTPVCYTPPAWSGPTHVGYFCAMPTQSTVTPTPPTPPPPLQWTGKAVLTLPAPTPPATTPVISATLADVNAANYKVCRYTPVSGDIALNPEHPLDYTAVQTPLWNQNFLVISAGNGSTAYTCPPDSVPTPINANTYRHQPLT